MISKHRLYYKCMSCFEHGSQLFHALIDLMTCSRLSKDLFDDFQLIYHQNQNNHVHEHFCYLNYNYTILLCPITKPSPNQNL